MSSRDLVPAARSAPTAGPTNADWAALKRKLSTHDVSRPGDRSYPLAHQLFDPRFDSLRPSGIAYCGNATDVGTCIAFVKKFKMRFRVRSGGHSYAGWSSLDNGLVIDVSRINHFQVGNGTVTVGAGIDLIHFYEQLAARGLAVPGGSCPTVGLAGLALGGGIGVLSRQFGLTSDAIESLQIVTADGNVLNCDSKTHTDLLWASKGGGGGNFGVATSFTLRTHKLSSLVLFFMGWPWAKASRVISAWQSWAPHGPAELWSNMHLSCGFGGSPQITVGGTWLGSVAGANRVIRSLINRVGSSPSFVSANEHSFLSAMLVEAGCGNLTVMQCNTKPSGVLPRVPSFAKSDFFTDRLNPAGVRAAIEATELASHVHNGPAGGGGAIAFDALGGAVNKIHPAATAFVHRNALFDIQYSTSWTAPGSKSGQAAAHAWLRSAYADLHPHANGQAYQNYIDPDLKNWRQAYYGSNYPRLARIKKRYDPTNFFNFPQSITA
ncbi:MAG TPA: FAD-binding oxidoreductase [Streptosporangiaceae bacterium]|nr:FAD-binding oxidoreductase [Streptosporangiaceae bacterium]